MSVLFCTVAASISCARSPLYCGEAFCLSDKPEAVAKKEMVDFNVYQVDYRGERFAIYEGDNPMLLPWRVRDFGVIPPDILPPGFVEGRLYEGNDGYLLALRTPSPKSPTYVVAYETKHDPRTLQRFASILRAKHTQ